MRSVQRLSLRVLCGICCLANNAFKVAVCEGPEKGVFSMVDRPWMKTTAGNRDYSDP